MTVMIHTQIGGNRLGTKKISLEYSVCKVCGERTEREIYFPLMDGSGATKKKMVHCMCRCEREKREEIGLEKEARREAEGGDKRSTASQIEGRVSRGMAVISIAIQKVKEAVSVRMEQVGQEEGSILFEAPLAIAARDVSGDALVEEEEAVKKLEDIENERNFVAVDPAEKVLLVQVDARKLSDHTAAYLILENGSRIDIPFIKTGAVLKGKIENIPEGEFKLYLEK